VGTQRRSDPACLGAARAVHSGILGKITRVEMAVNFQEPRWRKDLGNVRPEDVDWEAFQFEGRIRGPFNPRKLREWQLFRETTNGIAGLWMCHLIDLAPWFLQDPYPAHAAAMGGVYLWKDGRETSDVFQAMVEYNDCLVTFAMSVTNGAGSRNVWYGTKGTLDLDRHRISGDGSRDPDRILQVVDGEKPQVESHMANFLRCVRTRETPRASVDNGFQHAVAGCMAAVSLETGRRVGFDRRTLELL
jgi:predicted dehydrogenase